MSIMILYLLVLQIQSNLPKMEPLYNESLSIKQGQIQDFKLGGGAVKKIVPS